MSIGFHRGTDREASVDDSANSRHESSGRDTIAPPRDGEDANSISGEPASSDLETGGARTREQSFTEAAAHADTERVETAGKGAARDVPRDSGADGIAKKSESPVGHGDSATGDSLESDPGDISESTPVGVGTPVNAAAGTEPAVAQDVPATGRPGTAGKQTGTDVPFFEDTERERLRTEWREVQGLFVDDPRDAVSRAGDLVTATVEQLNRLVAERKQSLDAGWSDESADTEALRQTFRSYRSFLDQLLGASR